MKTTPIILLIITLLLLTSCAPINRIILEDDPCPNNIERTYCHTFHIQGGTANITFPNSTGDFIYEVEA